MDVTDGATLSIHKDGEPGVHVHVPYGIEKLIQVLHRQFHSTSPAGWGHLGHRLYGIVTDLAVWCSDDYDNIAEGISIEGARPTRSNRWIVDVDLSTDVFDVEITKKARPLRDESDQVWKFGLHEVALGTLELDDREGK